MNAALTFIAGVVFGWCARWVAEGGPGGDYDRMEWGSFGGRAMRRFRCV